jgi:hypothetical protein
MSQRGVFDQQLRSTLDLTESYMTEQGYRGYDPYDGLESPLFKIPILRSAKIPRWGFQQVIKRLPFQVRPLLGIAKGYNPVTLGLAVQGLTARDRACGRKDRALEVQRLITELGHLQSRKYSGACWGYDFDWEARYACIPAGHPTVVATGFITNALYEAHLYYECDGAAELILDAAQFVLKDLNKTLHGDHFCWSYSPTDHQEVLNATMKGARLIAQAVSLGGDPAWLEDARSTIRYVVGFQQSDGSWPYSIGDRRSWADNFHTCYNLDCLWAFERITGDHEFSGAMEHGLKYYGEKFFDPSGAPKYYDHSLYPIDATCCGQSLITLVRFGLNEQAMRSAHWILENMALPGGKYRYQITRRSRINIPYMRWSTAWIFCGLSCVEHLISRESSSDDNLRPSNSPGEQR